MVKIKTQRQDYEQALAQAALLFSGWMSRFEAPSCHEQEVVVAATIEWLENTQRLLEDEDCASPFGCTKGDKQCLERRKEPALPQ
jgi:hypothetical protein